MTSNSYNGSYSCCLHGNAFHVTCFNTISHGVGGLSQAISDYHGQSRAILDYLRLSGTIWDYLGLSGTILDYLILSPTRVQVEAGESKLLLFEIFPFHIF